MTNAKGTMSSATPTESESEKMSLNTVAEFGLRQEAIPPNRARLDFGLTRTQRKNLVEMLGTEYDAGRVVVQTFGLRPSRRYTIVRSDRADYLHVLQAAHSVTGKSEYVLAA